MNKIKFSHRYEKLRDITESEPVTLLEVFNSNTNHLSDYFLDYDTIYFEDGLQLKYPLIDDMQVLVLLFAQGNKLFTTIRRFTESKFTYYETAIGEDFKLVIN